MNLLKLAVPLILFGLVVLGVALWLTGRLIVRPSADLSSGLVSDAIERYAGPMLVEEGRRQQVALPPGARAKELILESVGDGYGADFERQVAIAPPAVRRFDAWGVYLRKPSNDAVTLYVRAGSGEEREVDRVARDLDAKPVSGEDRAATDLGKGSGAALIRGSAAGIWGRVWINGEFVFAAAGRSQGEVDDFVELYPY
jgi:hypothetical protein